MGKNLSQNSYSLIITRPPGRLVMRVLYNGTLSAPLFAEFLLELAVESLITLGLTLREAEVLRWLAQGKTSSEIATILNISPRTISKHLTRVYQESGVENRHTILARPVPKVSCRGRHSENWTGTSTMYTNNGIARRAPRFQSCQVGPRSVPPLRLQDGLRVSKGRHTVSGRLVAPDDAFR